MNTADILFELIFYYSSTLAWKIPWADGGACWATVHGVEKSQTQLSDFNSLHFTSIISSFFFF